MIDKSVKDIYLRKSSMSFNDDINVMQMDGLEFTQQNYNTITGVQVVEVFEKENLESPSFYKCFFRLRTGVRLVKNPGEKDERVYFEIVAEHDAVFNAQEKITQETLEEFSGSDEISNSIWPYWKEHVSSLCSKAGLSTLILPPPKKNKRVKITGSKEL